MGTSSMRLPPRVQSATATAQHALQRPAAVVGSARISARTHASHRLRSALMDTSKTTHLQRVLHANILALTAQAHQSTSARAAKKASTSTQSD